MEASGSQPEKEKDGEAQTIRSASEEISDEFKTLIKTQDLESLKQFQHTILGRLQDSNAVLSHFNEYSEHCFAEFAGEILRNTRLLKSMKSDLDSIFQKLRHLMELFLAWWKLSLC